MIEFNGRYNQLTSFPALVIMLFSLFLLISLNLINKFTFRVKNLNKF